MASSASSRCWRARRLTTRQRLRWCRSARRSEWTGRIASSEWRIGKKKLDRTSNLPYRYSLFAIRYSLFAIRYSHPSTHHLGAGRLQDLAQLAFELCEERLEISRLDEFVVELTVIDKLLPAGGLAGLEE